MKKKKRKLLRNLRFVISRHVSRTEFLEINSWFCAHISRVFNELIDQGISYYPCIQSFSTKSACFQLEIIQSSTVHIKLNLDICHCHDPQKRPTACGLWLWLGYGWQRQGRQGNLLIQTRTQIRRSCTCRRSAHLLFVVSHTRARHMWRQGEREGEGDEESGLFEIFG